MWALQAAFPERPRECFLLGEENTVEEGLDL